MQLAFPLLAHLPAPCSGCTHGRLVSGCRADVGCFWKCALSCGDGTFRVGSLAGGVRLVGRRGAPAWLAQLGARAAAGPVAGPLDDLAALSVQEAADRLGISRQAVIKAISTQRLPAVRVGGIWIVREFSVLARTQRSV